MHLLFFFVFFFFFFCVSAKKLCLEAKKRERNRMKLHIHNYHHTVIKICELPKRVWRQHKSEGRYSKTHSSSKMVFYAKASLWSARQCRQWEAGNERRRWIARRSMWVVEGEREGLSGLTTLSAADESSPIERYWLHLCASANSTTQSLQSQAQLFSIKRNNLISAALASDWVGQVMAWLMCWCTIQDVTPQPQPGALIISCCL